MLSLLFIPAEANNSFNLSIGSGARDSTMVCSRRRNSGVSKSVFTTCGLRKSEMLLKLAVILSSSSLLVSIGQEVLSLSGVMYLSQIASLSSPNFLSSSLQVAKTAAASHSNFPVPRMRVPSRQNRCFATSAVRVLRNDRPARSDFPSLSQLRLFYRYRRNRACRKSGEARYQLPLPPVPVCFASVSKLRLSNLGATVKAKRLEQESALILRKADPLPDRVNGLCL